MKLILKCTYDQLFPTTIRKRFMKKLIIDTCSKSAFCCNKKITPPPFRLSGPHKNTKIGRNSIDISMQISSILTYAITFVLSSHAVGNTTTILPNRPFADLPLISQK